jgi:hypothetical protein
MLRVWIILSVKILWVLFTSQNSIPCYCLLIFFQCYNTDSGKFRRKQRVSRDSNTLPTFQWLKPPTMNKSNVVKGKEGPYKEGTWQEALINRSTLWGFVIAMSIIPMKLLIVHHLNSMFTSWPKTYFTSKFQSHALQNSLNVTPNSFQEMTMICLLPLRNLVPWLYLHMFANQTLTLVKRLEIKTISLSIGVEVTLKQTLNHVYNFTDSNRSINIMCTKMTNLQNQKIIIF